MVAVNSLPELYLPRKLPPTPRDRGIYTAVVVDGHRQADVAMEARLTQGRVAQIVKRVAEWVAETTGPGTAQVAKSRPPQNEPPGSDAAIGPSAESEEPADGEYSQATDPGFTPDEALRLAEYVSKERLEYVYATAMGCFRRSQEDSYQKKVKQVGAKVTQETIIKKSCGQVGYLSQAMRAALAVARLQGVDLTGKHAREAAEVYDRQADEMNPAEELCQVSSGTEVASTEAAIAEDVSLAKPVTATEQVLARSTNKSRRTQAVEAPTRTPEATADSCPMSLDELDAELAAA